MDITYFALLATVFSVIITAVNSLECYDCSSLTEPKCGTTWGFTGSQADKYKVNCTGENASCDKFVGDIRGPKNVQHVYRFCWNQTLLTDWKPDFCKDEDVRGEIACHCITDGCNGQSKLVISIATVVIATITSWACV